jgi:hypothetical protein
MYGPFSPQRLTDGGEGSLCYDNLVDVRSV